MKKIERGVKKSLRFLTYICAFVLTATITTFFSSNKRNDHSTNAPESPWSGISITHADTPHDSGGDQWDGSDSDGSGDGCFGFGTKILMSNGQTKNIDQIALYENTKNGLVKTVLKILLPKHYTYQYLNDIATGLHAVLDRGNRWLFVRESASSSQKREYGRCFMYDIDTEQHTIQTPNAIYTDFNEIDAQHPIAQRYYRALPTVLNSDKSTPVTSQLNIRSHTHGFVKGTPIEMADGTRKNIEDVQIGDLTPNGEVLGEIQYATDVTDALYDYNGTLVHGQTLVHDRGVWKYVQQTNAQRVACRVDRVYTLVCASGSLHIRGVAYRDGFRIPTNSAFEQGYRATLLAHHNAMLRGDAPSRVSKGTVHV